MQGHSLFRKDTYTTHQKHHGLSCKRQERIHGVDKINYVSQVKKLDKGLKEKHILLGSFLCYPLAGQELCNASSEILAVRKCKSLGNFKE